MECFLAQMRVQKGEILERLSSARNFSNMDDEENYCAANKAIRQVSRQPKPNMPLSVDVVLGKEQYVISVLRAVRCCSRVELFKTIFWHDFFSPGCIFFVKSEHAEFSAFAPS